MTQTAEVSAASERPMRFQEDHVLRLRGIRLASEGGGEGDGWKQGGGTKLHLGKGSLGRASGWQLMAG